MSPYTDQACMEPCSHPLHSNMGVVGTRQEDTGIARWGVYHVLHCHYSFYDYLGEVNAMYGFLCQDQLMFAPLTLQPSCFSRPSPRAEFVAGTRLHRHSEYR